ncbi:GAF domain-containing sensor histidine kinase [Rhizobium sp. RAF56]|uniref:GAF domain-containing sensor histidine kinase n=1 Tax=Rhizobium sp. RAF56 TaxID=3233062 RepID=UPI003F98A42C
MNTKVDHEFQAELNAVHEIHSVSSILDVIQQSTGMGFVVVARVTVGRWVACEVLDAIDFGLRPGDELMIETTICHEIRQSHVPVAIDHVAMSDVYRHHHTPLMYGFQSYISVPIVLKDGTFFGTLCAIDRKPALVNNTRIIGMFTLFAELIAHHLDARDKLIAYQTKLNEELEIAVIREQFIAVLGHDLRNPLASMISGTRLLAESALDDRAQSVVAVMLKSADRMSNLVDNVMDFARGKLGGGISLNLSDESLQPTLAHVVDEMRSVWPDRLIEAEFDLSRPISVDHSRIAQLFSNLLANALTHGSGDSPIRINVSTTADNLELWISNKGEPIPHAAIARLFRPFTRLSEHGTKQGLGLGLYIASKIAEAHGGTLSVTSSPEETRFTLRLRRSHLS